MRLRRGRHVGEQALTSIPTLFDIAVVGGGVAGCAAAIRLRQKGFRVALFDTKATTDDHYKRMCTHFIQPSAVPLLKALGLERLAEPDSSVQTKARLITSGGIIDPPGGYESTGPRTHALNLERRVLDPALRDEARRVGVELCGVTPVHRVTRDGTTGRWLITFGAAGDLETCQAKLVVAADGRQSPIAHQLGNQPTIFANERAARFGHFTGIDVPAKQRSIFVLHDREMAFLYPLTGGRTLLSLYVEKHRVKAWRSSPVGQSLEFLRHASAMLNMTEILEATPIGHLHGYGDYPNLIRRPVWDSVPFVGDACMSLDPMSGVGCGFALQSACLLADTFTDDRLDEPTVARALSAYQQAHDEVILPHANGICADSVVAKNADARRKIFETIRASETLSEDYLALTGRIKSPREFQRALMSVMLNRGALEASSSRSALLAGGPSLQARDVDR